MHLFRRRGVKSPPSDFPGPNDGEEDEQLEVISLEGCDEEAELHEENTADGNDADSSGDDQQEADVAFRT